MNALDFERERYLMEMEQEVQEESYVEIRETHQMFTEYLNTKDLEKIIQMVSATKNSKTHQFYLEEWAVSAAKAGWADGLACAFDHGAPSYYYTENLADYNEPSTSESLMQIAVGSGDVKTVKLILDRENVFDEDAASSAIHSKKGEMFDIFFERMTPENASDLLMMSVLSKNEEALKRLLKKAGSLRPEKEKVHRILNQIVGWRGEINEILIYLSDPSTKSSSERLGNEALIDFMILMDSKYPDHKGLSSFINDEMNEVFEERDLLLKKVPTFDAPRCIGKALESLNVMEKADLLERCREKGHVRTVAMIEATLIHEDAKNMSPHSNKRHRKI